MAKRVMVFGTFDGIHEGHVYFLTQAKSLGDELIVVVARDKTAKILKGKLPKHSEKKRLKEVENVNLVNEVVLGDELLGDYKVIDSVNPDIIACGYDQDTLMSDLNRRKRLFDLKYEIIKIKKNDQEC